MTRRDNKCDSCVGKVCGERGPSPKELMDAIAKLRKTQPEPDDAGKARAFGAEHAIRVSGGQVQVIDGYAQFELASKEDAVAGAAQSMEVQREHWPGWQGETEIRQIGTHVSPNTSNLLVLDGHSKARDGSAEGRGGP